MAASHPQTLRTSARNRQLSLRATDGVAEFLQLFRGSHHDRHIVFLKDVIVADMIMVPFSTDDPQNLEGTAETAFLQEFSCHI